MSVGLNHVTITVKDKKEAEFFYCNLLGLEKKIVGNNSLWIKIGGQFIHISQNQKLNQSIRTFNHFAIEVNDLLSFLEDIINKGVEVFDLDDNQQKIDINSNLNIPQRTFFTHDPSGNLVEFIDSKNIFFKPS